MFECRQHCNPAQHVVEAIDQRSHDNSIRLVVRKAFVVERGPQPWPGKRPSAAKSPAAAARRASRCADARGRIAIAGRRTSHRSADGRHEYIHAGAASGVRCPVSLTGLPNQPKGSRDNLSLVEPFCAWADGVLPAEAIVSPASVHPGAARGALTSAMVADRAVLLPACWSEADAEKAVNRLVELTQQSSSTVVLVLNGDGGDSTSTLRIADTLRLLPSPVYGVAASGLDAVSAAVLQACTYRYGRRDMRNSLAGCSGWTEVSVAVRAGLPRGEATATLVRDAERNKEQMQSLARAIAARTSGLASDLLTRIHSD